MTSQAVTAALTSLNAATTAIQIASGNISNEQTYGYKMFTQLLGANADTKGVSSAGVTSFSRLNADIQGAVTKTGISTDIAIQGSGMFVVSDPNNSSAGQSIYYTRDGSFTKNKAGQLALPSGELLMAWKLDQSGNLPPASSTTASLSPVSINELVSQATPTSSITYEGNLNSTQQITGKAYATLSITNSGSNASPYNSFISNTDVLYPDPNNNLTVGSGITLTIPVLQSNGTTQMTPYDLIYGGFVDTKLTDTGTNLVGTSTDTLTITVGSNTATVTRGSGADNLTVLQNIASQINTGYNSFLTARVVDDGTNATLLVAPTDATQAMSFGGSGTLQAELGYTTNTVAQNNRFASLSNLSSLINKLGSGVSATVGGGVDTSITISSEKAMSLTNYQPNGSGNWLQEFNYSPGYAKSLYNPYDINYNMANGTFAPDYTKNIVVYDAMGNAYDFTIAFLKTGVNEWATEVYSLNASAISNGRIDGLIQAGTMQFSDVGQLQSFVEAPQRSISTASISNPSAALGATNGQTLTIQTGASNYTFTYNDATMTSVGTFTNSSTAIPTSSTLQVTVGSQTWSFSTGTGANDLATIQNLASQINATGGPNALKATVNNLGGGNYSLAINPVDVTQGVTVTAGSVATALGFTPASLTSNANNFSTLYELADRINATSTSADPLTASVIFNSKNNTYQLLVEPANPANLMTFGGTANTIGTPLGVGNSETIANALGLQNTTTSPVTQLGQPVTVNWSSLIGASPNTISFNFGTPGNSNSMSQINQSFLDRTLQQNGAVTGQLSDLAIDNQGYVVAKFTNGKVRNIYQIPIAYFINPNGLNPTSNTLFSTSANSGPASLFKAGHNGTGTIESSSLENSNVDTATELSNLITAQTWYQAAAKVVSVENNLFQDLLRAYS